MFTNVTLQRARARVCVRAAAAAAAAPQHDALKRERGVEIVVDVVGLVELELVEASPRERPAARDEARAIACRVGEAPPTVAAVAERPLARLERVVVGEACGGWGYVSVMSACCYAHCA